MPLAYHSCIRQRVLVLVEPKRENFDKKRIYPCIPGSNCSLFKISLPGLLKSQAAHVSSSTIADGCSLFVRIILGYMAPTSRWYIIGFSIRAGLFFRSISFDLISSQTYGIHTNVDEKCWKLVCWKMLMSCSDYLRYVTISRENWREHWKNIMLMWCSIWSEKSINICFSIKTVTLSQLEPVSVELLV